MDLHPDGLHLRDEHGRQRVLHGINLACKGSSGTPDPDSFRGQWSASDIADLAGRGFSVVRLAVIWAAVEPEPGRYDEAHLGWLHDQLELCHEAGLAVVLDAHQDLYSQSFADGAPAWATLTDAEFTPTELWSDAYLDSAAVQQALDAFWADAPGPGGVGLQDRFAAMWGMLADRFGSHPAVIGYDLLNEPTPGGAARTILEQLVGTFAHVTGQDPLQVAADFDDPAGRFGQLGRLDDVQVHRAIGDELAGTLAEFDRDAIAPMVERVRTAIRRADPTTPILREHCYFANLGIPAGVTPPDDPAWVYSPHGYDLTVDTDMVAESSLTRTTTLFSRMREEQQRLDVPALLGEWGAFGSATGITDYATALLDLFDSYGWSWTYWCWTDDFATTEAAAALTRPRPWAFAGTARSWRVTADRFEVDWDGHDGTAPSLFWIGEGAGTITVLRDGEPVAAERRGGLVEVPAAPGRHELIMER